MEIRWSEKSLQKVKDIGDFIAEDSKDRAISFVEELISSVNRLEDFPESGPIIIENPAFRQVVFKKYRVIYRLQANYIEITTVVSPKQTLSNTTA